MNLNQNISNISTNVTQNVSSVASNITSDVSGIVGNITAAGNMLKTDITNLIQNASQAASTALSKASAAIQNSLNLNSIKDKASSLLSDAQSKLAAAISSNSPKTVIDGLKAQVTTATSNLATATTDAVKAADNAKVLSDQAQVATVNAQAIISAASSQIEVSPFAVLNKGTTSGILGFVDPSGKYPLPNHNGEADTPRLASGQNLLATIINEKNDDQYTNIPVANSGVTWDQSPPAYNAEYPYNMVHQTESGHIIELDDTKGSERINIHHMGGTFTEIDSKSNQTNKVKGIRTVIVDEDDLVYISGSGHVNIDGDMSVRVGGQCQVQIIGDANIVVEGNMTHTVNGDYSLKVNGSYTQEVIGSLNIKATLIGINSLSTLSLKASTINTNSTGDFNLLVGGSSNMRSSGAFNIDGSSLGLNGGLANPSAVTDLPSLAVFSGYSPSITTPKPTTKLESYAMQAEGPDNISSRQSLLAGETPMGNTPTNTIETVQVGPRNIAKVMTGCDFGDITYNTQLSKNFTLEMLLGDAGKPFPFGTGQHGLADKEIVCNLRKLCLNVLEPLREKYSSIGFKINSGYRNAGVLSKSGKISQHELGQAADISFTAIRGQKDQVAKFYAIAKEINAMGLPIDQLIFETNPEKGYVWIHVSYNESATLPRTDGTAVMSYYGGNSYIHSLTLMS